MNTGGDTCHIGDGTSLSSSSNTAGDEAEGLTAYDPYHVLRGELCRELMSISKGSDVNLSSSVES